MPPIFVGLPSTDEQIESLSSYFDGANEVTLNNEAELSDFLLQVAAAANQLFSKDDPKETGSFIGEFTALLQKVTDENATKAITEKLIETITQNKDKNAPLRLKTLNTLYNFFPTDSELRYQLLLSIFKYAVDSHNTFTILPIFSRIDAIFAQWKASDEKKRNVYKALHEVNVASSNGKATKNGYILLRKYLSTFENASEEDLSSSKQAAVDAVVLAIKLEDVHQYDDLLEYNAIKQLKSDAQFSKIFELLELFVGEKVEAFDSFKEKYPDFLVSVGLSPEDCLKKIRLLSLTTLATERKEITYAQVSESLGVSIDDVEFWVISAVAAKLLDAKIDQLQQRVSIYHCAQREFSDVQWKQLQSRLNSWRGNVHELLNTIQSSGGLSEFVTKVPEVK